MKIALLGDTALYGKFSIGEGNPKEILKSTAEFLKQFDYIVLNLETPFAENNAKRFGNKSAYIKSNPLNIEVLKYLGVNAVCLANNHMFDFGYDSYKLTKEILKENQIDFFGVENKDLKIEFEGNKIAFNGFCCYSTNPINASEKGVNPLNFETVSKTLNKNKIEGYESIFSIHAGQEHVNYPNYDHIELARKLSEIAPYVYYGHHPHVLQGVETFNNALIAYSLGNFCFDDVYNEKSKYPLIKMSSNNKQSAILSLEYINSKLVNYTLVPLFDGQICIDNEKQEISKNVIDYSKKLTEEKDIYIQNRQLLLNNYLQNRKGNRNFSWYIKRLNYNSLRMIINNYVNNRKYNLAVKRYL